MTLKAQEKRAAPGGAGRRCIYAAEKMQSRTFRMTATQFAKLERLGGAAWLREKIDAAKDPAE